MRGGDSFVCYLLQEFRRPSVYFFSILIGLAINFLSGSFAIAPFYVPLFVQVISRAVVNHNNRYNAKLLRLPSEREDPAFIMDREGNIILSAGKTSELLDLLSITHVNGLIGPDQGQMLLDSVPADGSSGQGMGTIEAYSEVTKKWYLIHAKAAENGTNGSTKEMLVWFLDISTSKLYDDRLTRFFQYTGSLVTNLDYLVKKHDAYSRLANYILHWGAKAVFITRSDNKGNLHGQVFKLGSDNIVESQIITVDKDSTAPVSLSRRLEMMVSDDVFNYSSQAAFETKYPFNPKVIEFLAESVSNFISYHAEDVSIIIFNRDEEATAHEKRFVETLVNVSRSVVRLIDLAYEHDEQFIQKIMGLCVAAEYNDETTGAHILRVNKYSEFLARKMGMDDRFVETIGTVAALHDIGKVAMSHLIQLNRSFTEEERALMQMHTIYGAQIIETMDSFASKEDYRMIMARNIALYHHQKANGQGYPKLMRDDQVAPITSRKGNDYNDLRPPRGDEIPVEALIVGLADRYDALRSARHHKPELPHSKVVELIKKDDRTGHTCDDWYGESISAAFCEQNEGFNEIYLELKQETVQL